MKYLRIIATMNPKSGGPCQGIRNSIPVQKDAGIENEVLCFDEPSAAFLKEDYFKVHAIGPAKGPYAYCERLSSWLEEKIEEFDIIVIHGLWLYNSFGTYRVWSRYKRCGKKVPSLFVMPHGMLDPYFQRSKDRRLKAVRNWIFWKLIEKRVINGVNGLLFTCEQELKLAKETFNPYTPERELNIGYGIPDPPKINDESLQSFLVKCGGLTKTSFWLFLSRIHSKKGIDILIKAYLRLKSQYNQVPDLVVAGPGLDTIFGRKIQKLGKDDQIHFPGMLHGNEKWAAFHCCQAFILPSHQENFGIAVVEAMACKKAILITDKVNIWKEIHEGNAGIISEDNQAGVFRMLQQWHNKPASMKAEMSHNAFELYKEKFAITSTALQMVQAISSVTHISSNEINPQKSAGIF